MKDSKAGKLLLFLMAVCCVRVERWLSYINAIDSTTLVVNSIGQFATINDARNMITFWAIPRYAWPYIYLIVHYNDGTITVARLNEVV